MATTWIMLRGLIREQRHWGTFPDLLRQQNPDKRILTLDVAGNGKRNQETSPASIHGLMESVRDQLSSIDAPKPYNLIAISMGAMIALEWLAEHGNEVQAAVLINTSLQAFSPFYKRLRPSTYPSLLKALLTTNPEKREQQILAATSNLRTDHKAIAAHWAKLGSEHPTYKKNIFRQLAAAARYKAPHQQPSQPVLLLNGANDRLVHPDCSARIAQQWHLPMQQHPTAGHDLSLDDSAWVAKQIQKFFAKQL